MMIKLSLAGIQSVAAPVLVPFTPAMLLGNEIYTVLNERTGFWMALVAGIATALGLEFIGGSTCYAAVKLYRRRDWYALMFAVILVTVYVAAGMGSILYIDDSKARILAIFFILTPVAYIAYALIHDLKEDDDRQDKEAQTKLAMSEARVKELNAEARLVRAQGQEIVYPRSFGRSSNANEREPNEVQVKIFSILDEDSTVGPREMSRRIGCAPSTAHKYIQAWKVNGNGVTR